MKSGKQINCLPDFFYICIHIFLKIMNSKKLIRSFGYAIKGIKSVVSTETNMQIHLIIGLLVIICGFLFSISLTEWMLCLICIGLVFGMEMINTAIEKIVDLVSPESHPLAGLAKDIAAGAVLICAFISVVVGLTIFIPKGLALLISVLQ